MRTHWQPHMNVSLYIQLCDMVYPLPPLLAAFLQVQVFHFSFIGCKSIFIITALPDLQCTGLSCQWPSQSRHEWMCTFRTLCSLSKHTSSSPATVFRSSLKGRATATALSLFCSLVFTSISYLVTCFLVIERWTGSSWRCTSAGGGEINLFSSLLEWSNPLSEMMWDKHL